MKIEEKMKGIRVLRNISDGYIRFLLTYVSFTGLIFLSVCNGFLKMNNTEIEEILQQGISLAQSIKVQSFWFSLNYLTFISCLSIASSLINDELETNRKTEGKTLGCVFACISALYLPFPLFLMLAVSAFLGKKLLHLRMEILERNNENILTDYMEKENI